MHGWPAASPDLHLRGRERARNVAVRSARLTNSLFTLAPGSGCLTMGSLHKEQRAYVAPRHKKNCCATIGRGGESKT